MEEDSLSPQDPRHNTDGNTSTVSTTRTGGSIDRRLDSDIPPEGDGVIISTYLTNLRHDSQPGQPLRSHRTDAIRKDLLHWWFAKYNTFENSPNFTEEWKTEWQDLLVDTTNWHHERLRDNSKHRVARALMKKRKEWFESRRALKSEGGDE